MPWAAEAPPTSGAGGGTRHLVAKAGGHHPSMRLHWGLFSAFPLPYDKGNPVYLPFCWYISVPCSPSVNPRQTEHPPAGLEDAGNAATAAGLQLLHQLED